MFGLVVYSCFCFCFYGLFGAIVIVIVISISISFLCPSLGYPSFDANVMCHVNATKSHAFAFVLARWCYTFSSLLCYPLSTGRICICIYIPHPALTLLTRHYRSPPHPFHSVIPTYNDTRRRHHGWLWLWLRISFVFLCGSVGVGVCFLSLLFLAFHLHLHQLLSFITLPSMPRYIFVHSYLRLTNSIWFTSLPK